MFSPLHPDDRPAGVVASLLEQDNLRRVCAEERIREREALFLKIVADLAQSREGFRELIENINGYVIFTMDVDGLVTSWNRGLEKVFGYSEMEILGRPFATFFTPEDRVAGEPERSLIAAIAESEIPEHRWHLRKNGTRFWGSGILCALRDANGRLIGISKIMRELSGPEPGKITSPAMTAEIAATAALWRKEHAERQRLEAVLLTTIEDERQRLGLELHDGLCQQLSGMALLTAVLANRCAKGEVIKATDLHEIGRLLGDSLNELRLIARGLNPIAVQHSGLLSALEELAANARRIVDCTLECPEMLEVDDASALHLYRIAQEAVANAARHGGATRIFIRLGFDGGHLVLSVRDNGSGKVRERIDGMGLSSMAYRAAALGGSFRVERNTGGGAEIVCRVPLDLIASGSTLCSGNPTSRRASRSRKAGTPLKRSVGVPV